MLSIPEYLKKYFISLYWVIIMKGLKSYIIWGIILVSILGTLGHFIYQWSGENPFIGLFFSTNESTWEHMKLFFFPMIIYSYFMNKSLKPQYPSVTSALFFGVFSGTVLIPIIFYTYSGILGFNLTFLDISTFYVSVIIAFISVYNLTLSQRVEKYRTLLLTLLVIFFLAFLVFTMFPPNLGIFISPV